MQFVKKYLKVPTKETYFSSASISNLEMYDELFDKCMIPARYLGANIFDKGHKKFNLLFISMISLVIGTFIINIYDIYLFRKDLDRDAFCILTFTAAFQSYAKMYTFVFLKENCIELKIKARKFQKSFQHQKAASIFEIWMQRAAHIGLFITVMYVMAAGLIVIYPAIFYFWFKEKVLYFGIEIPMLDWQNSWFAYGINYIHQSVCLICFILSSISSISVVVVLISTAFAHFDILSFLLEELDQIAIRSEKDDDRKMEIKAMIKMITEHHMELINFLKLLENTFSRFYFVDFASLIFQKTVVLFAMISFNFIPGYMITPTIAFQLLVPCVMGTILTTKGENYYHNVCKVSWHLMPISDQKSIQMIMKFAVLPRQLSAGLKILDMETFVEIYKAIYSYLMLLESFK